MSRRLTAGMGILLLAAASSTQAQVTNGFNNGSGFPTATVTFSDLTASPPSDDFSEVATSGAFSDPSGLSGTYAWTVTPYVSFDVSTFIGTASGVGQTASGWGVTNGNNNLAGSLGEALTFEFDLSGLTLGVEPLKLVGLTFGQFTDGTETFSLHRFAGGSSTLVATGSTSFAPLDVVISDGDIFSITADPTSSFRVSSMILNIGVVPEPTTSALSALGLGLLLAWRQLRRG